MVRTRKQVVRVHMLVHECKSQIDDDSQLKDAKVIVAFKYNKFHERHFFGLPVLMKKQVIYGIVMDATTPIFYEIPVTTLACSVG
jgi:hypothetical protein